MVLWLLLNAGCSYPAIVSRLAGDRYVFLEYGPMELDISLRVRGERRDWHIKWHIWWRSLKKVLEKYILCPFCCCDVCLHATASKTPNIC